ncbi:MAG TPA: SgcJ/EcaC family oxidoreductase [Desulfomonilaceae bacterium]|nr:SgcJ/EcaC family oxidoreductase [Desulfomonilaceae bacterium]
MRNWMGMIGFMVMMTAVSGLAAAGNQIAGREAPAATADKREGAEEQAIRSTAEAFAAAFNKSDAKAIAALWTNDCEYVDETGRVIQGREAIEKDYGSFFAANPGMKLDLIISSVKIVGGNAAIEDGTTDLKRGDGTLVSKGSYTAVHLKEGGKWLVASVREYATPSLSVRPNFGDLDWLIGDWRAAKGSNTVDFSFRWVADKKFIELSYTAQEKGTVARSGIQVIGRDPSSGDIISWSFDSTGGFGQGQWTLLKKGLIIESWGITADGAPAASTYLVSRIDGDRCTWQSVNRKIAGQRLNDAEPVVLKRKSR